MDNRTRIIALLTMIRGNCIICENSKNYFSVSLSLRKGDCAFFSAKSGKCQFRSFFEIFLLLYTEHLSRICCCQKNLFWKHRRTSNLKASFDYSTTLLHLQPLPKDFLETSAKWCNHKAATLRYSPQMERRCSNFRTASKSNSNFSSRDFDSTGLLF